MTGLAVPQSARLRCNTSLGDRFKGNGPSIPGHPMVKASWMHIADVEDYQVALAHLPRRLPNAGPTLPSPCGSARELSRTAGVCARCDWPSKKSTLSELTKELGESDAAGGCGGRKQSEMGLRSRRHLAFCECRR